MGPYGAGNSNFQFGASSPGATSESAPDLWSPYQPLNIPNPKQIVDNEKSFPQRMFGMVGDGIGQIGEALKGGIPKAMEPSLNWLFPTTPFL